MKKYLFSIIMIILVSCKQTQVIQKLERVTIQQGTYDIVGFELNTVDERALLGHYKELLAEISRAKPGSLQDSIDGNRSKTLDLSVLLGFTTSGVTTIESIGNANFDSLVLNPTSGYLKKAVDASSNSHYIPDTSEAPVNESSIGGRFTQEEGSLFDKYGIDIEEMVQKTFYGSIYDKVFTDLLTLEKLYPANIDKALVLYGAPTSFPNGLQIQTSDGRIISDVFIANYAARRDNSNGSGNGGFYGNIKTHFITLKQLSKEPVRNNARIDSSIVLLRKNWEMALMASAVYSFQAVKLGLRDTLIDQKDMANMLHNLSEGLGLISSFRGVKSLKIISDVELEELLGLLAFSNPTAENNPIKYITKKEILALDKAIERIQTIYKFTASQVNVYFTTNDIENRNIGMRKP